MTINSVLAQTYIGKKFQSADPEYAKYNGLEITNAVIEYDELNHCWDITVIVTPFCEIRVSPDERFAC